MLQIEYFDASDQIEASFLALSLSCLEIPHYLELEGNIIFNFLCSYIIAGLLKQKFWIQEEEEGAVAIICSWDFSGQGHQKQTMGNKALWLWLLPRSTHQGRGVGRG